MKLREIIEGELLLLLGKRQPKAKLLLNALYTNPIITVQSVEQLLGVSPATANRVVQDFVTLNILRVFLRNISIVSLGE